MMKLPLWEKRKKNNDVTLAVPVKFGADSLLDLSIDFHPVFGYCVCCENGGR